MSPMDDAKTKLGSNIRRYRTKLGLSQEALADSCELHRTYIGSIERGERNISLDNIVKVARALRIHPSELLKGVN